MPLVSQSGTIPSELIIPINPPIVTQEQILDQQSYIKDTFTEKTAFNPQTYAEEFKLLQRYTAGSRISVTYFLRSTPTGGLQRSTSIDPSSLRNPVQTSYTEIKQFEIVVQERGLQSGFNADNRETKVTGVALLYPGMQPHLGDLFITPIGDSTYGIFQVMEVDRLSYRQGSNHKITFFLREFATEATVDTIRQSVTKTLWFDKETYLGDATTLLKEDSYIYLKTLRQYRGILIRYYYNTFYDKQLGSIIGTDGVYDPYLVAYLNGKISIQESIYRPAQLYPGLQNYDNCIWSRLNELSNRKLTGLQSNYNQIMYRVSRWDVAITSLTNRIMIGLDNPNRQAIDALPQLGCTTPPTTPPTVPNSYLGQYPYQRSLQIVSTGTGYVLSNNFYTGDKTAMTPFEFLVYAVIATRKLPDIGEFIEGYLNRYAEMTYAEQYYFIPLYFWLIDVAIDSIAAHNSFMT